jgi:hypothetical protein
VRLTGGQARLKAPWETPLRPTQGSDSGSALEDDELRSARPRARTRAQPQKTTDSAPPDPGLGLGLGPRRRRTPLRPTQGSDSGLAPEDDELRSARPQGSDYALASADGLRLTRPGGSDSTSATEDRLDLDLGGASTSPNLGRRPATSLFPLRARPRVDPSGLGHAATFTRRLRDPLVSKRRQPLAHPSSDLRHAINSR